MEADISWCVMGVEASESGSTGTEGGEGAAKHQYASGGFEIHL